MKQRYIAGMLVAWRADGSTALIARKPNLWTLEHIILPGLRGTSGEVDESPERPKVTVLWQDGTVETRCLPYNVRPPSCHADASDDGGLVG